MAKIPGADKGHKQALKDKRFDYLTVGRGKSAPDNRRTDLVMIGDSQLPRRIRSRLAGHCDEPDRRFFPLGQPFRRY